ncbi:MAG: hypothetical protein AB7G93_07755 [Bdellovibrionales bacterium]
MITLRNFSPVSPELNTQLASAWKAVLERPDIGFPRLAAPSDAWSSIAEHCEQVTASVPDALLVLGIGGSSLGTQVLYEAFRPKVKVKTLFLESPDPYTAFLLHDLVHSGVKNPHVTIVSKSGTTLETLSWVESLAQSHPDWLTAARCTVVASPGNGPLQQWARSRTIPILWIPSEVGGRFSVLSAVSMFPAGIMGLNLEEFRKGAAWALEHADLASQISGQVLHSWEHEKWITQMWTYSEALRVFGEWWQQLWSESLAKRHNRNGATAPRVSSPMSCRGPRDQHSQVQQLIEGAKDKQVFVVRVNEVEADARQFRASLFSEMPFHNRSLSLGRILGAEAQAFEQSLNEAGVPFAALTLDALNERSLGALFMLWQIVIAQLGERLNIDAFDQPGVELGKKHAKQILRA